MVISVRIFAENTCLHTRFFLTFPKTLRNCFLEKLQISSSIFRMLNLLRFKTVRFLHERLILELPPTCRTEVTTGVFYKKFLQNSLENTFACVSLIKKSLNYSLQACSFFKIETPTHLFSCEFFKVFNNTFCIEYLRATAFDHVAFLQPDFTWIS